MPPPAADAANAQLYSDSTSSCCSQGCQGPGMAHVSMTSAVVWGERPRSPGCSWRSDEAVLAWGGWGGAQSRGGEGRETPEQHRPWGVSEMHGAPSCRAIDLNLLSWQMGPQCYRKKGVHPGELWGCIQGTPSCTRLHIPSPGQSSTAFKVLHLRLRSDRSRQSIVGRPLRALLDPGHPALVLLRRVRQARRPSVVAPSV